MLAAAVASLGSAEGDLITALPGLERMPKAKQYSGFLNVSDPQGPMRFHYWLATSESAAPEKDPVVLWMNGGPGASSIGYGLFTELGPFFLDDASTRGGGGEPPRLHQNPYSWSKVANLLFLEAPPSVGYSYCEGEGGAYDDACKWDDFSQAKANYGALLAFLERFPELAQALVSSSSARKAKPTSIPARPPSPPTTTIGWPWPWHPSPFCTLFRSKTLK